MRTLKGTAISGFLRPATGLSETAVLPSEADSALQVNAGLQRRQLSVGSWMRLCPSFIERHKAAYSTDGIKM